MFDSMKAEALEKLSFEELERMADEQCVELPDNLEARVDAALLAACLGELESASARKKIVWTWVPGLATALASLALVLAPWPKEPVDSFTDPSLAYSEVAKTLELVSSKMSKGSVAATETKETIDRINECFIKK